MKIENATITNVSDVYKLEDKHTPGVFHFYRDFVVDWFDDTSGRLCSLSFTLRDRMKDIPKLAVGKHVSLDYELFANEHNGRFYNNAHILGNCDLDITD